MSTAPLAAGSGPSSAVAASGSSSGPVGSGVRSGDAGAGAGDVEEDAAAEDQQQQRPDPVQAQGLVGLADQEQDAEAGEGEAEGEGDGVELVAAHQGASGGAGVVGTAGRVTGSSNGPASWKERGSLARRTSITP